MLSFYYNLLVAAIVVINYFCQDDSILTQSALLTLVQGIEFIIRRAGIDSCCWLVLRGLGHLPNGEDQRTAGLDVTIVGMSVLAGNCLPFHHVQWKATLTSLTSIKVLLVCSWWVGEAVSSMSISELWLLLEARQIGMLLGSILDEIVSTRHSRIELFLDWDISSYDRNTLTIVRQVVSQIRLLSGGELLYGENLASMIADGLAGVNFRKHELWNSIIYSIDVLENDLPLFGYTNLVNRVTDEDEDGRYN